MKPQTAYTRCTFFASLLIVFCAVPQTPPSTDIETLIKSLNTAGEGGIANAVRAFQAAAWEASSPSVTPAARKTLNVKLCEALEAEQPERTQLLLLRTLAYTGNAEIKFKMTIAVPGHGTYSVAGLDSQRPQVPSIAEAPVPLRRRDGDRLLADRRYTLRLCSLPLPPAHRRMGDTIVV